jgi:hypothetical protein
LSNNPCTLPYEFTDCSNNSMTNIMTSCQKKNLSTSSMLRRDGLWKVIETLNPFTSLSPKNRKNKISHLVNVDVTPSPLLELYFSTTLQLTTTESAIMSFPCPIPREIPYHLSRRRRTKYSPRQEGNVMNTNAMFRYTYSTPNLKQIHDIIRNMRRMQHQVLMVSMQPSTNLLGLGLIMTSINW